MELGPDIWSIIYPFTDNELLISYFVFEDRLQLRRRMNQIIQRELSAEFGHLFEDFISKLRASGGIIAGSFVASLLANNLNSQSDIDIFLPILPQMRLIERILSENQKIEMEAHPSYLTEWFSDWHDGMATSSKKGYEWDDISQIFPHSTSFLQDRCKKR